MQIVDMPLLMEVGAHRLLRPSVVVICSHDTEVCRKRDLQFNLLLIPKHSQV